MWKLLQYQTVYIDLYNQCDTKLKIAVDQRLQRLKELGNKARAPISKHLEDKIYECRADSQRKHVRFLYFFHKDKKIIVAVGIFKKGQKTPRSAIEKAKKIRKTLLDEPELFDELTTIH